MLSGWHDFKASPQPHLALNHSKYEISIHEWNKTFWPSLKALFSQLNGFSSIKNLFRPAISIWNFE